MTAHSGSAPERDRGSLRRVRLPADHSSPAAGRDAVRAAVAGTALTAVLDEALLLTTELCTNVVLHAGTDLDLEIVTEPTSVTVTVVDFRAGPLGTLQRLPAEHAVVGKLAERGRGLLLVDQLATCWGTVHHRGGKGVWFRLERPELAEAGAAGAGATATLRAPRFSALAELAGSAAHAQGASGVDAGIVEAMEHLAGKAELRLPPDLDRNSPTEVAEALLSRLCPVIGAAGGVLLVDEADGQGPRVVAAHGAQVVESPEALRVPLDLTRPWVGEILLSPTEASYAQVAAESVADRLTLVVENERLRRADTERRASLMYLAEVSELLAQSLDAELTLALIPRLVVPRLGQWCALHTADDSGELKIAAATHADEAALPELLGGLDAELAQLREALHTDGVVPLAPPADGYAVALSARRQQFGTLSVGRPAGHRQGPEELAILEEVARRAALAIDNARIHAERRAVADALQKSLLPPALPEIPGIDFGAEYVPTGEGVEVGGDFYDMIDLPGGGIVLVVGDVSGKGVAAAAVTGLVRDVTRVLVRDGRPLPEVLVRLNETLVERGAGRFCTLALAAVTPDPAGQLRVALHLAGHDQPVLLHADGTTSMVGACGTALGLLSEIATPRADITLAPGDTLIFYTDGVTERRRGPELFGPARLRREAGILAGFPAAVVAARLRAATLGYSTEPPRDDIAILALRNDATPT